jgi:hypothetical protein
MITPIMEDITTLLGTLPYELKEAQIDPSELGDTPALNVRLESEDYTSIANDPIFETETVVVIEAVATNSNTYYSDIKTIVNNILTTLLTNEHWFSKYEYVKGFRVKYKYENAGETNVAAALIMITIQNSEIFQPVIEHTFNTAKIDLDDAYPFDEYLADEGPDGRIEIEAQIDLPQT